MTSKLNVFTSPSAFPNPQRLRLFMHEKGIADQFQEIIYDMTPAGFRDWIWWNPIIHFIGQMRMGFYRSYDGDYISWIYVFGISLSLFVVGAYLMQRHEGTMIER